jgi:dihydroorotate dehydrogenase
MYRFLFSVFLRRLDPERAHHLALTVIRALPAVGVLVRPFTQPKDIEVRTLGLRFASPFGVAAGFDKDGSAIRGLYELGFGHVEVGTVTAIPQSGNPRPRLFRLIADRAVINRMGFNNRGAEAASVRIARAARRPHRTIIGANIGKSRVVDVDDAIADYVESARVLAPVADYLAVNVSSPNTPGLRGLQELDKLAPLLEAVIAASGSTPVLLKISPDLTNDEALDIARLAVAAGSSGIVATNTTLSRHQLRTDAATVRAAGAGGLSGPPLASRSLELLRVLRSGVPADFCIISAGGVETAADVAQRLDAGATLVQGYTAFLYRGPLWAREINRGLERRTS